MKKKKYSDDFEIDFSDNKQLSYSDNGLSYVDLYLNDNYVGSLKVFTDRGGDNKEYVCINYEIVKLDLIKKR